MANWQSKYCLDRNSVRWVLLEGIITRTTQTDDPTAGRALPVSQISRIEKTSVERLHRSLLARPALYAGLLLLILCGWLAMAHWLLALPGLVVGACLALWGLLRLGGQKEALDSFQIIAPGIGLEEWRVLGSHHEVLGFIEGLRLDMQEIEREKIAASSQG